MKIYSLSNIPKEDFDRIMNRSNDDSANVVQTVQSIVQDVRKNGNKVIQKYTKMFDKADLTDFIVSQNEVERAYNQVSEDRIAAIKQAAKNIRAFHEHQLPYTVETTMSPVEGITLWREWRSIERVGMYVPGGKALYPSTVLMTCIPAQVAGCKEIVITTPPNERGEVLPELLIAADIAGVTTIYKIGGAQAIAALAYGTETIQPVYKIFGPGNTFVTTAKEVVSRDIAIDMPAGPSEVLVIADESANAQFIATDLMADAEHGEDSACVLITTSKRVAKEVTDYIQEMIVDIPSKEYIRKSLDAYGAIIYVNTLEEAIHFSNQYAPEHLQIMTDDNNAVLKQISNAGSVFLGTWTSKSSGDYATGANHVLPTGKRATSYPPLGIDAFGKWMQVQECTKEGLYLIRNTVELFGEMEQLPAHVLSTKIRFNI